MDKIVKKQEVLADGQVFTHGDIIKIDGEGRRRFMFMNLTINTTTGKEWIDCIELMKGNDGPFRSFRPERARSLKGKQRGKN